MCRTNQEELAERLEGYEGISCFDDLIETGNPEFSKEELSWLTDNDFWGNPITTRAIALVAAGKPYQDAGEFNLHYIGGDGKSEVEFNSLEALQQRLVGLEVRWGSAYLNGDYYSRYVLPGGKTWVDYGLEINSEGILRRRES